MSQSTNWGMPSEPPAPPASVASRINAAFNALLTMHSGTTAPAYKQKGCWWLDTSADPHPIKIYANSAWVQIGLMDAVGGTISWDLGAIAIADVTGLQTALDAKVPTTRQVLAGGLLSGGGALSGNVTLTATLASQAEAEAGVRNDVFMTPLRAAQAISALVPAASESTPGLVEKATTAEAEAGTDDQRFVSPAGLAAVVAGISGGAPTIQHFTSSDTYTPTSGKTWAIMEAWGGGGGGGGSQASQQGGGGGGAGAYSFALVDISALSPQSVSIGSGGNGGSASGGGSSGGSSSVGSLVSAAGGNGGSAWATGTGGNGGSSGSGTGDFKISGQGGGSGTGATEGCGGYGGSTSVGGGGRGGRNSVGATGSGYGSGGGGAHINNGSTGDGRPGYVRITEF